MNVNNSSVCILWTDGTELNWQRPLQYGRSGLVLEYSNSVLKIPRISGSLSLSPSIIQSQLTYEDIEHEKDVYRRLEGCPGVIKCLQTSTRGIELERMKQGSLERYIETHMEQGLPLEVRLQLSLSAVEGLCAIHGKWVLPFDVHARNLLLTDDLHGVRYCDFADSVILPFIATMSTIVHEGASMKVDIFRLGSVLYAIMAWTTVVPDLIFPTMTEEGCGINEEDGTPLLAQWPSVLPDTTSLPFLGKQIRKCWTRDEYHDSAEIYGDIQSAVQKGIKGIIGLEKSEQAESH